VGANLGILRASYNILEETLDEYIELEKEKGTYIKEGLKAARDIFRNHQEFRNNNYEEYEFEALTTVADFYEMFRQKGYRAALKTYEKILDIVESDGTDNPYLLQIHTS